MKTAHMLMITFDTTDIKLKDICEKYFGITFETANSRARRQKLPVPCFRGGSQKSEWLVNVADLAKYIDQQREEATKTWQAMKAA